MIEQEIISAIGSVGFPIACCIYMMVSNNKTLQNLTNAVHALTAAVNTIIHDKNAHTNELPIGGEDK